MHELSSNYVDYNTQTVVKLERTMPVFASDLLDVCYMFGHVPCTCGVKWKS